MEIRGNVFTDILILFFVIFCAVGWLIKGVVILLCHREGRCPEGEICEDPDCRRSSVCKKHQMATSDFLRLIELIDELQENTEKE